MTYHPHWHYQKAIEETVEDGLFVHDEAGGVTPRSDPKTEYLDMIEMENRHRTIYNTRSGL